MTSLFVPLRALLLLGVALIGCPSMLSAQLSEEAAREALRTAFAEGAEKAAPEARKQLQAKSLKAGGKTLRFLEKRFGEAPKQGHALFISMHGGGGAPARVNDQQWNNQIRLYEPKEGIVVAPRAPGNTWDLWHRPEVDRLFGKLIAAYVATGQVDSQRVYLMGYSAGGDGTYQLAPRMADRFAAASAMAGHPNETVAEGLRTLPFQVFMGGEDKAYDRAAKAGEWKRRLGELARKHQGDYEHRVVIYEGLGHWMKGRDREALPWMAKRSRKAWPKRITWVQDDVTHERFYWLSVPEGSAKPRERIRATVAGQTIALVTKREAAIVLRLHDDLVNLDRPVHVTWNGTTVHRGRVARTRSAIETSLVERLDAPTAAFALLTLNPNG